MTTVTKGNSWRATLGLLVVSLFTSLLLIACGSDATATPAAPATTAASTSANGSKPLPTDKPISLNVRCYNFQCLDDLGIISSQVRSWAAQYPNVKVNVQAVEDWAGDILGNDIAANSAPDLVFYEGSQAVNYIQKGLVQDISSWFDLNALKADYPADYYNNFMTNDGKLYGLYEDTESRGIYYRADLLKDAGLTEPKNGWTYDDVISYASKLTKGDVAGICIGKEIYYELAMAVAGGYKYGSDFTYDSPGVKALYQFYSTMIKNGSTVKAQAGLTKENCRDLFSAGKTAMIFLPNNAVSQIFSAAKAPLKPEQVGWVSLPVSKAGDKFVSVGGGFMWIAPKKNIDPVTQEYVKDLLTWVTNKNNQTEYALKWGFILSRLSYQKEIERLVQTDSSLQKSKIAKYWSNWLEVSRNNITPLPKNPNSSVWVNGLVQGVESIQSGQTVDQAVKAATDFYNVNKK